MSQSKGFRFFFFCAVPLVTLVKKRKGRRILRIAGKA